MKIVKAVIKALMYRTLIFSLALVAGIATFYWSNWSSQEPEINLLPVEVFNLKDCKRYDRPDPLILILEVDKNRQIKLNQEPFGNLSDTSVLESTVLNVFQERGASASVVYGNATYENDKKILIRLDKSIRYKDVVTLVGSLNKTGANPVILNTDYEFICPRNLEAVGWRGNRN